MRRYLTTLLFLLSVTSPTHAIITFGGEGRLLAPPTGAYGKSGTQFTGEWGAFAGTAIAPHHFITAVHVGGGVGDTFTLGGKAYTSEAVTVVKGTDLAVWRVRERFPIWAPLYDRSNESGKEMILYGRGCRRGDPLIFEGVMRGWNWGEGDGLLSWGRNRVEGTMAMPSGGQMLVFDFARNGGDEEGTVGSGDSGGGVFVQDGTTWKLAGVNHASGGRYSSNPSGAPSFMGALYDARGLYQSTGDGWKLYKQDPDNLSPTLAFASRISYYAPEVRSITGATKAEDERTPLSVRTYLLLAAALLALISIAIGIGFRRGRRL